MFMVKLNRPPRFHLLACPDIYGELQGRQIFTDPPVMRARPPAKPARHSPEAKPMADGKGEAARGTSGQVSLHGEAHPLNTYKEYALKVQCESI